MATFKAPQIRPASNSQFNYFSDINFQYGVAGDIAERKRNIAVINQQILYLLTTVKGTREFEPTFGSKVPSLLFEPCDAHTGTLLKMAIIEAIGNWIPRLVISIQDTNIIPYPDEAVFYGTISYYVKDLGVEESLALKLPSLAL